MNGVFQAFVLDHSCYLRLTPFHTVVFTIHSEIRQITMYSLYTGHSEHRHSSSLRYVRNFLLYIAGAVFWCHNGIYYLTKFVKVLIA